MFMLSLSSVSLRAQCEHATKLCGAGPVRYCAAGTSHEQLTSLGFGNGDVLVHDFAPDAHASMAWLDTLTDVHAGFGAFALLGTPVTPVLHALAQQPHRFACVDIAVASELGHGALASAFGEATRRLDRDRVIRALLAAWPMDPMLTSMARSALAMQTGGSAADDGPAHWPTLDQLLTRTGIRRATFVRHAHRAGFHPALRFLHVLRVVAVADALRARRETIARASARFGYTSTWTLRRHFAEVLGMTPSASRYLAPDVLFERVQTRAALLT